jgi:translation initiation factor 5B
MYRTPIITVLGHIDHGKTTLLDRIRNTKVTEKEAGGITQSIGSTFVPISLIKEVCKEFKDFKSSLPGLLFIDTPGHEAFISMRERGCTIADISILVIDIVEGFMPQTIECIEILKRCKTPFVIALNKIDKISGWKSEEKSFLKNYEMQLESVKIEFEKRFYEVISKLENFGLKGERLDRITDFTKEIAVVPISAKTGEGIPELLYVLVGLCEKFLKSFLLKTENSRGIILEVKETKGIGKTLDAIIQDGKIEVGNYLVIFGKEVNIVKVKALFIPKSIQDIRAEKRFEGVKSLEASRGVKIVCQDVEKIIPGSNFLIARTYEEALNLVKFNREECPIEENRCKEGLILKADALGSLDALRNVFKNFKIKYCNIGQITKEDVFAASINEDDLLKAIISFNIKVPDETKILAKEKGVEIFSSEIIYELLENYLKWRKEKQEQKEREALKNVVFPAKIRILPGYVFRASKPAILGCEVLEGTIKPEYELIKMENEKIISLGRIREIQAQGKRLEQAKKGDRVAISITDAVFNRNVFEGDIIYTNVDENSYKILMEHKHILSDNEITILEEIKNRKKI